MSLWRGSQPLILASRSRARQTLLAGAAVPFEAIAADIDERAVEAASGLQDAGDVAALLATAKATAVSLQRPGRLVLGADQTLALGEQRFSKPDGRASAAAQLAALAGRTHMLHSALAVLRDGRLLFSHVATARMTMRPLDPAAIETYLDAAGPNVLDSVGVYQLEGLGAHLFEEIAGDYFTILGLPLLPLLEFLRREGLLAW